MSSETKTVEQTLVRIKLWVSPSELWFFWKGFNCFDSDIYSTRPHFTRFMVRNPSLVHPHAQTSQHFIVLALMNHENTETVSSVHWVRLVFVSHLSCRRPSGRVVMGGLLWGETQERHLTVEQASSVCFVSQYCFKIKNLNKFFAWSCNASESLLPIGVFLAWLGGRTCWEFHWEVACFERFELA